ncbi:MAG: hypothetical protein ACREN1_02660 [Candidatus Dormibacteria bacterium]
MVPESNSGDYPTYVKARDLVDEPVTILGGDFRGGKFGPEVIYQIRRGDGSPAQLSLSRRPFRELGLQRIWLALEAHPKGVAATLRKLEPDKDGTEFEVFLLDPFEVGRQPSPERVAWEQAEARKGDGFEAQRRYAAAFADDDDPGPTEADAPDPGDVAF